MTRASLDYTAAQVADLLGVSQQQVNLCKLGRIRAYNVGAGTQRARWRITREALAAFRATTEAGHHEATQDSAPGRLPDAVGRVPDPLDDPPPEREADRPRRDARDKSTRRRRGESDEMMALGEAVAVVR